MTQLQTVDTTGRQLNVQSIFTPFIDLNDKAMSEVSIGKAFEAANKNAEKYFIEITTGLMTKMETSKKMWFGAAALVGVALVGFVAIQVAGLLAAGLSALVAAGVVYYFWEYKLPLIISRAKSELITRGREAALREQEKLRQIEIDHLERLKLSAEKNPIETLEIELNTMESEREALGKANTIVGSQYNMLEGELDKSIKENPGADFTNEKKELSNLKAMCDADEEEFSMFVSAVEEMKKVLKEARSRWNFALKLDSALTQRDKARGNETQRKILADTALDTIKRKNAELFARVRTRAVQLSAAKTIKVAGHEIDVSSVKLEQPAQQS